MKKVFPFIANILSIMILLGIIFAYAMFQGGFVSWFLFYSFLPIFLYHFLLLFYSLNKWKISREFSRNIIGAGDEVIVTVHVKRTVPFPIYYAVFEDVIPDSLQKRYVKNGTYNYMKDPEKLITDRTVKRMLFIGFKKQVTFSYTLDELPRGEHHFTENKVRISDVLGFIKKQHNFNITDHLKVRPKEREMNLPKTMESFDQGSHASSSLLQNHTNVVTGVREYAPGDRFSWIHWKQSAKSDEMMTKEFEQERGTNTILILDAHCSSQMNVLAFEATIELTLAFLSRTERQGLDVDLLITDERTVYFPATGKKAGKEKIKHYLMKVQPNGASLALSLSKNRTKLASANHVVILTSELDHQGITALKQLQKQMKIVLFYVYSAHWMNERDMKWIEQLRGIGIQVYEFTEKELVATQVEVKA